jgi:hypothetical protein
MRAALHMLLQRFVLQHEEHVYKELKNANDRQRYEGYGYMLGIAMEAWIAQHFAARGQTHGYAHPVTFALLQDAPFAVVNSLFLLRTVDDLKRPHDDTNVTVLLLVLLSSVASLMYKLMKLRAFPTVWREHSRLLQEEVRLIKRAEQLKMEAQATVVPQSEGSDVDSDVDSVSSDDSSRCATKMLSHGRPSHSAQLESAAMRDAVLSTSTDGAGVCSTQAAPSSLSQLPRVELTTFEICILPECGR